MSLGFRGVKVKSENTDEENEYNIPVLMQVYTYNYKHDY